MQRASASDNMWKASVVSEIDLVIWPAINSTRKNKIVMLSMHEMRILSVKWQQPQNLLPPPPWLWPCSCEWPCASFLRDFFVLWSCEWPWCCCSSSCESFSWSPFLWLWLWPWLPNPIFFTVCLLMLCYVLLFLKLNSLKKTSESRLGDFFAFIWFVRVQSFLLLLLAVFVWFF